MRLCSGSVVSVVIMPMAMSFAIRFHVVIMPVHGLLEILRTVWVVMRMADHPLVQ